MVKTKNLTLMVTAAVLAALTCVATMVVQIPMPLKGYVNLGDVMCLHRYGLSARRGELRRQA